MNVFVNILDNNLPTLKGSKIIAPLIISETPKKNGPEIASDSLISSPKFEPGLLFDLVDENSSKVDVNSTPSQSLPCKLTSSQSTVADVDLKHYEATPGDVGDIGEAGDLLCLVLGSLLAVLSVVPAKATSCSPPSVGLCNYILNPCQGMKE
ncbi:hypothetical protein DSO57_1002745 [Entomophthora muscae]|uniref:Uncharacterized protein n=1 Tax=Entomophthora muscae TaxID=34485 RepID=A0ACC2UU01_9FUNG|nr:hypothetical protein DSO57_1002745 [Entomophthora muscae]